MYTVHYADCRSKYVDASNDKDAVLIASYSGNSGGYPIQSIIRPDGQAIVGVSVSVKFEETVHTPKTKYGFILTDTDEHEPIEG
jgi:hypothetical protein